MNQAREIAAALLHDVGKYVARTARNLPEPDAIDARLVPMLLADVYSTYRGTRASERFAVLEAELHAIGVRDPRLLEARTALSRIDALEADARGGDAVALATVARAAIEVERALRSLAIELGKKGPGR